MKALVSFFFALFMSTANAVSPVNLSCVKNDIIHYYESGAFTKETQTVLKKAHSHLLRRIETNRSLSKRKKLAVVLDIDDTAISNFNWYKKDYFNNQMDSINRSYLTTNAPAIKPVLSLYQLAATHQLAIFFISFRPDKYRAQTMKTLRNAGYSKWTKLYLPSAQEMTTPSKLYKANLRKSLTKAGYQIILNIGDQESDCYGGYAEKCYKIPNPLYSTAHKV